jgi:cytoskeletal protein CcmA (bactofilin family)
MSTLYSQHKSLNSRVESTESTLQPRKTTDTVLGKTVVVNGEIQGDENLTICGRVDGHISLSKTLTVDQSGVVKAEIYVKEAIISGVVVGNITAEVSVHLTETARMIGDIRSPRVVITTGALIKGEIDMGERPLHLEALPENSAITDGDSVHLLEGKNTSTLHSLEGTHPELLGLEHGEKTHAENVEIQDIHPFQTPLAMRKLRKKVLVRSKN